MPQRACEAAGVVNRTLQEELWRRLLCGDRTRCIPDSSMNEVGDMAVGDERGIGGSERQE